jgi:hypothetical protein
LASKQTKKKQIALGVLTASMAVSPLASFATPVTEGQSEVSHAVPLAGNGHEGVVAPNASIQLTVDQDAKEFKSVRQQLEKQSFGVVIVSETGEQIFLDASKGDVSFENGTITISNHPDFDRYTSYSATVLVKADYQQAIKGKVPQVTFANGFGFQTGSAVGEATKVVATVEDATVRVTDVGKLEVVALDDYGNHATDATLIVNGEGTGNDKVESTFPKEQVVQITDGTAEVELTDKSANDVTVSYEVVDNNYADVDGQAQAGTTVVEFTPGKTDHVELDMPNKIQAGKDYTITGEAEDVYGNNVEDGTAFDVTAEKGTVSNEAPTTDGEFSFDYTAPTQVGKGDISIVGDDFEYVADNGIVVVPSAPAKVTVSLPSTITAGTNATVTGSLKDEFGNAIPNQSVTISGALTGTVTTDVNGNFSASLKPGTTGSITANVGGVVVPLTNTSGTPITSVSVTPSAPVVAVPKNVSISAFGYSSITVSGRMTDASGNPVANTRVSLMKSTYGDYWSYGTLQTGMTDANGNYSFSVRGSGILVFVKADNGAKSSIIPLIWGERT